MKIHVLLIFLFFCSNLFSQSFTEFSPQPLFPGVGNGSIAISDVDLDGDQDIIIAGRDMFNNWFTKLYINDGTGIFIESSSNFFEGAFDGSLAFADVDNDGDEDLMTLGRNNSGDSRTLLYFNDGSGTFTKLITNIFLHTHDGSLAFADVDNDGDMDVITTGKDSNFDPNSNLYLNDGLGNFNEDLESEFIKVDQSSIAFADVDGDEDQDVLITGWNDNSEPTTNLYINDGLGRFELSSGNPFIGVELGDVAFADIDNDNDQDLLISGESGFNNPLTSLYVNDGAGNFSEVTAMPFANVDQSAVAFVDVDGDNDKDLIVSGETWPIQRISVLYENNLESVSLEGDNLGYRSLKLYPTPSIPAFLNIDLFSFENKELKIEIYNLNGKLILQEIEIVNIGNNSLGIDCANLLPGFYLMNIGDKTHTRTLKFEILE